MSDYMRKDHGSAIFGAGVGDPTDPPLPGEQPDPSQRKKPKPLAGASFGGGISPTAVPTSVIRKRPGNS